MDMLFEPVFIVLKLLQLLQLLVVVLLGDD
jgi:hypothetical protein